MTRWWGKGKWCCGGSEGCRSGAQKNPERSLCSLAGLKPGLYTRLAAGEDGAGDFHGFGQATADWAEDEGGDGALGSEGEVGGFGWELEAAVEAEAGFAQEFRAKAHVFGAIDAPEPELFFVALEEIHRLFELLHGFVEVGSQEKDAEKPSVSRVAHANADTVFPRLIAFDAAAIVIADCGHAD
jgi:hypothetical protein